MTDQLFTGSYPSDALTEAKQLRAENERLRAALTRLSTAECFGNGAILGQYLPSNPFGQEIVARMNFARTVLQEANQCTPTT